MLCCAAEIGMLVFGIITLAKGRFALSGSRVVQGAPARVIGVLLLLPLVVGQGGELILGMMWGLEKGLKGQPVELKDVVKELQTKIIIVNAVAVVVPLLAVLVIALSTAKPPTPRRLRREEDYEDYEEDDDEPRRRRRREEEDDYEDEPPRSQRGPEEPPDQDPDYRIQDRPRP